MQNRREESREARIRTGRRVASRAQVLPRQSQLTLFSTFEGWYAALERRHLERLTPAEVRRALQSLSSLYVERRAGIVKGAALAGAGKRAAFALFYGPQHYQVTAHIAGALGAGRPAPTTIHDLGCGTGAAGAAWAIQSGCSRLRGVDLNPWAVRETRWCWSHLGLEGRVQQGRVEQARLPGRGAAVLLAYTANELDERAREHLLAHLVEAGRRGAQLLIIEPISGRTTPWWPAWSAAFTEVGGRSDEWRFPADLPESWQRLDRGAGLDHRELTARSLSCGIAR